MTANNATIRYPNAYNNYPTGSGYPGATAANASQSSSAVAYGMNAAKLNAAATATKAALNSASAAKGVSYNALAAAKATGGAKKSKSATPKTTPAKTTKASAKAAKATKTSKSAKTSKSGGALMDDIKNLAVPFAILLAKQGFESAFDKKKAAAADESKSPSSKRRGTMAGGSACTSGCGMTGGQSQKHRQPEGQVLQKRFNHIAKEIEDFLNKY